MYINSHAHIFNFQSQNTSHARRTLTNRLSNEKWPKFLVDAVDKLLKKLVSDEHLDEAQLLRELFKALKASDHFKKFVENVVGGVSGGSLGVIIHGDLDKLGAKVLRDRLRRLSMSLSKNNDVREQNVEDLLDFLLIGLQPSIRDVADILMEQTPENDAVVALMMDITEGGDKDTEKFKKQAKDTAIASLYHPGRILPFFAVNPNRTGHLALLKNAVEKQGFLGVKLYPSLGYKADSAKMRQVYQYCVDKSLPIITHCNQGGFYFRKMDIAEAEPNAFSNILRDYPALKICFAHFGGDDSLASADNLNALGDWTKQILDLIDNHPNAYTDISYHVSAMNGSDAEVNYFRNIAELIDHPVYGRRILFGSDYQLVRMRVREENYRAYFEQNISAARFEIIARHNPRTFLGMPDQSGSGAAPNVVSHAKYLGDHNTEVNKLPASWVVKLLQREPGGAPAFVPNPFGPAFTPKNPAHYYTYGFFYLMHSAAHSESLSMENIGKMAIRDIPGWPLQVDDPKTRNQKFLSFAKQMRIFMENTQASGGPGAKPEQGISGTQIQNKLKALFARGSSQLFQFGELIDRVYKFPQEKLSI